MSPSAHGDSANKWDEYLRRRHSFYARRDSCNTICAIENFPRSPREVVSDVIQKREIDSLRQQNSNLLKEKEEAIISLKKIHKQQRQLYDDFKLLRGKYDDLKSELSFALWDVIPSLNNETNFRELAFTNHSIFETNDQVGDYHIGLLLGEGQFADVRLCTNTISKKQFAMKIIAKAKVVSVIGLQRVQTEINILKQIKNPNIVQLVDVINSPKHVYIITEVGGRDLFEFFEANPNGVDDSVAQQIILGIAAPLEYLHSSGICHRDIKPENILLRGSTNLNEIMYGDVKICDFGQSVIVRNAKCDKFSDLCGSPGFFAPEMILDGNNAYNGFAADVWSLGCVMLELTRGHKDFCHIWMASYDYNNLQNEQKFASALQNAVFKIHDDDISHKYPIQSNFLREILILDPVTRIKTDDLLHHPWLSSKSNDIIDTPSFDDLGDVEYQSNSNVSEKNETSHFSMDQVARKNKLSVNASKTKRTIFRDSLSSRARKHFAGVDGDGSKIILSKRKETSKHDANTPTKTNGCIELRLPPIEPITPSSKSAKETILEADRIVSYF